MPALIPLPLGDGPKLQPFSYNLLSDDVEFLEFLGHHGVHGIIVKTRIRGRIYAIKFFTETEMSEPEYSASDYPTIPREKAAEFESHFTPFYQECRAYGRLKEVNCEYLAVKVYGYVSLKVDQALERKMRNALLKLYRIVKDWVEPARYWRETDIPSHRIDSILSVSHFPRMLEDLHEIHRCGIVIRDMSISQYVNGVLVDFSMAWTMPHPFGPGGLGLEPTWKFQSLAAWDLYCFQTKVIDVWNNYLRYVLGTMQRECRLQAYRHPAPYMLRPQPSRQRPFLPITNDEWIDLDMIDLPRHDPGAFNVDVVRKQNKRKRAERRTKIKDGTSSLEPWEGRRALDPGWFLS
ncbi:uncharacterized protein NECHADRAFT_93838 [Fusarium vanettenii 77-13-4]|uniref:Protein kinase domain-containing protein n=1 Tax=Fusarium vanettenii (strain ATCC MYA-4622 / CBS 123669 / FGSC 9596 / NRRL 45880 / 77-13-4) TaxID=660122 RepID=C7YSH6_FUSV7|nr:uncharacterized protein NECHADRAFT_93838 [Fusarium vanettenii 77-13-4]EEU45639.1 hypothetical protein NECHADRAFT_93838 [Fusarium vanettenii 77-13-4]